MSTDISWELYRSFLGVLKQGSLSGAARALDIAQPTVGRHIAALEKSLGIALFTRSQTGLMPTEAAQSLRGLAESMQSIAASFERAAARQGAGIRGTVRVTCSDVIGVEVLPEIVTALRDQYPELTVELVLTNRVQDLLHREADIAVRMARPRQQLLVARSVGQIEVGLYAHQRYLARHGTPGNIVDLAAHSLIGFDEMTEFLRNAGKGLTSWRREAFAMRTDSDLAQLALIRSGAGIGVCQTAIARRNEALVRVLPKQFSLPLETWITMHEDLRNTPRCRITFQALVAGLQRHVGHPNAGPRVPAG
jgi:DNA-binding transcriptional LysR family regulator